MICILSSDIDQSTDDVIDWLTYHDKKHIRINGNEFIKDIKCINVSTLFEEIALAQINMCWFRRWYNDSSIRHLFDNSAISNINSIMLYNHLIEEAKGVSTLLWHHLQEKKWLTNPKELKQNKLPTLLVAKNLGIEIPETIITTTKEELIKFKNKHKRIISKNITELVNVRNADDIYDTTTVEITDEVIEKLNADFFPSLFQELIEKEYEVRTFFLNGEFYSMAIFSQLDKKTEIDFRNYNHQNPNRTVPYKLPEEIENKLIDLMENVGFSTGSLDIIKAKDGRYVFLECNPVGQYGMTSYPCNYYLDEKIASYLANNDN